MNVQDAAYHTVHDYPGGAPALALRLGMSGAVLQNKVNASQQHHKVTLDESVRMQEMTGDHRILHAMAQHLGYVCVRAGEFNGVSDEALLETFTALVAELGDLSRAFNDAIADGAITRKEEARIKQEFYEMQQAGAELVNRIAQLVDDEKKRGAKLSVAK